MPKFYPNAKYKGTEYHVIRLDFVGQEIALGRWKNKERNIISGGELLWVRLDDPELEVGFNMPGRLKR